MLNETRSSLRPLVLPVVLLTLLSLLACSGGTYSGGNNGGSGGSGGNGGGSGGSGGTGGSTTSCQQMVLGQNASLGGFLPFPGSNLWNTDISSAPVDPNSSSIISNYVGSTTKMHPDFGTDPTYGIPYVIVDGNQNLVPVQLGAYAGDSDPGPMPVPATAPVEGGSSSTGDRHVLVLDNANCFL